MLYRGILRAAIKEAGLTQRSLAERIGAPESKISLLINNRYRFPKNTMKDLQVRIAKALDKDVSELFPE